MADYKVRHDLDDVYQVYDANSEDRYTLHQGSLADCEAWIRLTMDDRL